MLRITVIFLLTINHLHLFSQKYFHIISNDTFDLSNPLDGWEKPKAELQSSATVFFRNGYVCFYKMDESDWQLELIQTPYCRNNLLRNNEFVERGNINPGGNQPADFTRNVYNWLGNNFKDKWQSLDDSNLFEINGSQMVNQSNTTNIGKGAINIGTNGYDGQYKVNILGALWLDNGKGSTFIGSSAGYNDTTANTINIGNSAGINNKGSNSVSLGLLSSENNLGNNTVTIGPESGRNNSGNNLVAIGNKSAIFSQGLSNISIGSATALHNNSNYLIAIGQEAAYNNSGEDCISIGRESLYNNSGFENIAIGKLNSYYNTSGSRNVSVGTDGLKQNLTGSNNTAIGWRAGFNLLTSNNTFIGESAGDRTTTGTFNTFVGNQTGHDNRTGSENVAVGGYALYSLNTVKPSELIIGEPYQIHRVGNTNWQELGADSNQQDLQFLATQVGEGDGIPISLNPNNGNQNTAIGYRSLYNNSIGTGNVAIGYKAGHDAYGKSNKLYISNSETETPLVGGDFSTKELKIGGVQQFSIQYPPSGVGVAEGSLFYGTDGALYFKGGNGTVTKIASN